MALQIQGNGGTVAEVDGTSYRALRVSSRPVDAAGLGHYRLATTIPLVVTQAANGTLFSFRWGDATRLCVIQNIRLEVQQTSAAVATIAPVFEALIARAFTVADSAGTALTLTGNSFKKRTSMGTTLVTDMRKSAAAAGLTVGTRTLDGEAILQMGAAQTITSINQTSYIKQLDFGPNDHPVVFAANEGFIVRGPTIVFGATGTANLILGLDWLEVAAY